VLDLCRQIWLFVFTVSHFNDHPDEMAELERQVLENPYPQSPEAFCDQAEACITHDVLNRLGEIEAPTYVTVGDRDLLTPAHHVCDQGQMPDARVRVWQMIGHAPFWEIPDEFNKVTANWIKEH
jgi:pimeloyl-ACP methyl ester carboxylesterase